MRRKWQRLRKRHCFFLLEKLSLKHLITRKREEVRIDCVKNDRDESLIRMAAMRNKTRRWKKRLIIPALLLVSFCVVFSYVSHAEEYTYNSDGQVTQVVHDDGSITSYEYDNNGNLVHTEVVSSNERTTSTDEDGKVTESEPSSEGGDNASGEKDDASGEKDDTSGGKDDSPGKSDDKQQPTESEPETKTEESPNTQDASESSSETVQDHSDSDDDSSGTDREPAKPGNDSDHDSNQGANVGTGDPFPLGIVITVSIVALIGVGMVLYIKRKNRR